MYLYRHTPVPGDYRMFPFLFGGPFVGGLLGGLIGGGIAGYALSRPRPYPYPVPYAYPQPYPYAPYGGYGAAPNPTIGQF
ncbi:hypothetical protein J6TS2_50180 [Heyndrickxia sporothermodurans]|nr:hypothetical protein J6TS2_50180 [Heyndrickxia sporothermodurans]